MEIEIECRLGRVSMEDLEYCRSRGHSYSFAPSEVYVELESEELGLSYSGRPDLTVREEGDLYIVRALVRMR